MKKLGKILFFFTISFFLFAIFSPNLIFQENKAEAYCLSNGTGSCIGVCSTIGTAVCGVRAFILNTPLTFCVAGGGLSSGSDYGTGGFGGGDQGCSTVALGDNSVVNFALCETLALSYCTLSCSIGHLTPCQCTGSKGGTECPGDSTGLPNGSFTDTNLPWVNVNYSGNCTTGRKCEYYNNNPTYNCGTCGTVYPSTTTSWPAGCTFCNPTNAGPLDNNNNPFTPTFPAVGKFVPWFCGTGSVNDADCAAMRQNPIVNGQCGTADKHVFAAADTGWGAYTRCSSTSTLQNDGGFPPQDSSTSWSCAGSNGGSEAWCGASRAATVTGLFDGMQCVQNGSNFALEFDGWANYKSDNSDSRPVQVRFIKDSDINPWAIFTTDDSNGHKFTFSNTFYGVTGAGNHTVKAYAVGPDGALYNIGTQTANCVASPACSCSWTPISCNMPDDAGKTKTATCVKYPSPCSPDCSCSGSAPTTTCPTISQWIETHPQQ